VPTPVETLLNKAGLHGLADDSWTADPLSQAQRSRRAAWLAAGAMALIAALEATALVVLMPLKQTVPYTILVDRQSGYVELARGLDMGPISQNQSVVQAAVVQYVLARETFDATDLRDNYRKVTLWSDGDARQIYVREMQKANPASPLNQYPATTLVAARIKSVSVLGPGSALVRFDTVRRDQGAIAGEQRAYTAVIAYRFSGAPMRMEDRFLNPLGFQVTRYRRDAESLAPTPVSFQGSAAGATP
jgi:type IV secretion system protein VirB8